MKLSAQGVIRFELVLLKEGLNGRGID
jgi:hypothetical protein